MEKWEKSQILGVKIDNLKRREIIECIEKFLDEPQFHQIATVNPEFILEAQKNQNFKNILNNSNLNIADGFGIRLAFLWRGKWLKTRMAGADLMMEILRIAESRGLEIFLACRKDGLSSFEEIQEAILKIYPNIKIFGGEFNIKDGVIASEAWQSQNQNDFKIVLVNFGAPHQEIFINRLKSDRIRLAMGVGGSFDFLTGKIRRAPVFLRQIGLEWLWRFLQEPSYRAKRIFRAIIIFPIRIIFDSRTN